MRLLDEVRDLLEAKTPKKKGLTPEDFQNAGISFSYHDDDHTGFQKHPKEPGHYTIRKGYFYHHGQDSGTWAKDAEDKMQKAGHKVKLVDHGDHFAAFRGGDSVKKGSHFYAKFKHEED
jgi:hypothetical protein